MSAMNVVNSVITYVRRIVKTPTNMELTDNLIIDYINRFWIMDVDARMQLFDLKTKYQFQTTPGIDQYNMPLYSIQNEPAGPISYYPVYQGFFAPARVNGINYPFYTQRSSFFDLWPNYLQQNPTVTYGNGTAGPYTINLPFFPAIPGHVDMLGVINANNTSTIQDPLYGTTLNLKVPTTSVYSAVYLSATGANGQNVLVQDSGQFLSGTSDSNLYGLLMVPGAAPFGNVAPPNGYLTSVVITGITQATQAVVTTDPSQFSVGQMIEIANVVGMTELNGNSYTITALGISSVTLNVDSTTFTAYSSGGTISSIQNVVNYNTGQIAQMFFPSIIPEGTPISASCSFIEPGLPRSVLWYNNIITMRNPPDKQYVVELDAYLTPTAFLASSAALPFAYMAEYLARGAARKILSDTGDIEQFQFYEPLFREQENLVWKRSQRIFTSTRTDTIYSNLGFQGNYNQASLGT